jgi:hypothetical protein
MVSESKSINGVANPTAAAAGSLTGRWPTSWSDISPPDSVRFRKPFHGFESEWRRQSSFLAPTHSPVPRVQGLEDVSEWPCSSASSVKGRGREGAQRYPSRFKSSMRSNHSSNVRTYSFEFGNCDENQVTSEVPEWRRASVSSSSFQSIRRHTPFLGDLRSIRLKHGRFWFLSE